MAYRSPKHSPHRRPISDRWAFKPLALVLLFAALVLVVIFFPWDVLREPLNRYVSEKTGRKFEITRRLDVGIGLRGATVKADGIEFANPPWAREPYLVKAERAEFRRIAGGLDYMGFARDVAPFGRTLRRRR